MKAEEYARRFNDNPDTLGEIVKDFLLECREIMENRQASTDPAIYAIFNEQDQKWRAFTRLVRGVKENGFEIAVRQEMPEWVYLSWQRYRGGATRR